MLGNLLVSHGTKTRIIKAINKEVPEESNYRMFQAIHVSSQSKDKDQKSTFHLQHAGAIFTPLLLS